MGSCRAVLGPLAVVAVLIATFGRAEAAVVFFGNDLPGFTAAMSGQVLLGTEDFEGSTLSPNDLEGFVDPLTQGVANGPYPAGLALPMTVQSNLSGGAASSPNPRGVLGDGLVALSTGYAGATSDVVVANYFVDSLDWIFNPSDAIVGVGFNPLSFYPNSTSPTLAIQVYDAGNLLLGTASISSNNTGTYFLGIAATGGDVIGRVNFFSNDNAAEGGDNAILYQQQQGVIPEPGSMVIWGFGAVGMGLAAIRRRRGQRR